MTDLRAGDPPQIGQFRIVRRLGVGGMGVVYLAEGRHGQVALKVVRPELGDDPQFRIRFRREVQASFRVQGPTTVTLIDFDTEAEQPWMAVEYINGPPLSDLIPRSGPLSAPRQFALAVALADALLEIHDHGLVHRDLKPDNVLLPAEGPKVIDLGIAAAADAVRLTAVGSVLGAPGWLSPEQVETGNATAASDIFAWGCTVGYAACGRLPFGEGAPNVLLYRVLKSPPDIDFGQLSPPLRSLVAAATERDAASRPDSAKLLTRLLERAELPTAIDRQTSVRDVLRRDWQGRMLDKPRRVQRTPAAGAAPGGSAQGGATAKPATGSAAPAAPAAPADAAAPAGAAGPAAGGAAGTESPPTVVAPPPPSRRPAARTPAAPAAPARSSAAPPAAAHAPAAPRPAARPPSSQPPSSQPPSSQPPTTAQPATPFNPGGYSGGPLLGSGPFGGQPGQPGGYPGVSGTPYGGSPVPGPAAWWRRPAAKIAAVVLALVLILVLVVVFTVGRGDAQSLSPPSGLQVTAGNDAVDLRWQPVSSADGYRVLSDGRVLADKIAQTTYRVPLATDTASHQYTVVALGDGNEASPPSAVVASAALGPWGNGAPLQVAFPRIIPADPKGTGRDGQSCEMADPARDKHAKAIVTCDYPNGVYLEALVYDGNGPRDAREGEVRDIADDRNTWSVSGGGTGGNLYLGTDRDGPWRWWTFTERPGYAMYASWPDHTTAQLKSWWTDAPF